jgi:hypothetical protein
MLETALHIAQHRYSWNSQLYVPIPAFTFYPMSQVTTTSPVTMCVSESTCSSMSGWHDVVPINLSRRYNTQR